MMKFIKTRNVKSPERNANENAGIDFYIPNKDSFSQEELSKFGSNIDIIGNTIKIHPHSDVLIPSGIRSKFSNNLGLIAHNKSGIATKKKLIFGADLIDASYQGEWHFHLINWSDDIQEIEFGQKIIQFVPIVINTDNIIIEDKTPEDFFTESTSRGTDAFGSTGV